MSYTRKEKVKMNQLPDAIIIDKTGNNMSGQPTICTRELIGIIFAGMSSDEQYVPFSVAIDAESRRRCFGIIREDAYNRMCMSQNDGFHKFKEAIRSWAAPLTEEMRYGFDLQRVQEIGGYSVAYLSAP